jgi:hypothetical protein
MGEEARMRAGEKTKSNALGNAKTQRNASSKSKQFYHRGHRGTQRNVKSSNLWKRKGVNIEEVSMRAGEKDYGIKSDGVTKGIKRLRRDCVMR